jgi:hypothetical protein
MGGSGHSLFPPLGCDLLLLRRVLGVMLQHNSNCIPKEFRDITNIHTLFQ